MEFSNGVVSVYPCPRCTTSGAIAYLLHRLLESFVAANGLGTVLRAPFKVRLWEGKYREPDVLFMKAEHANRMSEEFWDGADLVMEVVKR